MSRRRASRPRSLLALGALAALFLVSSLHAGHGAPSTTHLAPPDSSLSSPLGGDCVFCRVAAEARVLVAGARVLPPAPAAVTGEELHARPAAPPTLARGPALARAPPFPA